MRNLLNKRFFETQNFLKSLVTPDSPVIAQIHATPGYPRCFFFGVTFHFAAKK